MKRQALALSLNDMKKLEKLVNKELDDIRKLGIECGSNIRVLFPIVNYPTKSGKRTMYCSDTWEFEDLKDKNVR